MGTLQLAYENPLKHLISTDATLKIAFNALLGQTSSHRTPAMGRGLALLKV